MSQINSVDSVIQTAIDASMRIMMKNMMRRMQKMINSQKRHSNSLDSAESSDLVEVVAKDSDNTKWHVNDIEFFDSYYDEKSVAIDSSIEYHDKKMIIRDVHLFIARAKKIIVVKEDELVRNNLLICLKDRILIWHTSKLIDEQRQLLRYDNELNHWEKTLIKQFKKSFVKTMKLFVAKRFIMKNVERNRESRKYAQIIIRVDKFAKLSLYNQMLQIWNELDIDFQLHVACFVSTTNLNEFLLKLDNRKHSWWKLTNVRVDEQRRSEKEQKNKRSQRNMFDTSTVNRERQIFQSDEYQRFFQSFQSEFQQNLSTQFSYLFASQWQNRAYQSQQQNLYSNAQSQMSTLSVSTSLKQIIESSNSNATSNASNFYSQRQSFRSSDDNRQRAAKVFHDVSNQENQSDESEVFDTSTDIEKVYLNDLWDAYQIEKKIVDYYDDDEYYDDETKNDEQKLDNQNTSTDNETIANFVNHSTMKTKFFFIQTDERVYTCRRCHESFYFNNKLHKHVRQCRVDFVNNFHVLIDDCSIIESKVIKKSNVDYSFRSWRYARLHVNLSQNKFTDEFCLNNDTIMSIADRKYVLNQLSDIQICRTDESVRVRDIDTTWHDISKYVMLNFFVFELINIDVSTKAHFRREIHLVNDLTAKILIDVNIIVSKEMIIDVDKQTVAIDNCEVIAKLHVTSRDDSRVDRAIRVLKQLVISSHTHMIISVKIREQILSSNRDYSFNAKKDSRFDVENDFFAHITNAHIVTVQVRNVINQSITISKNAHLDKLQDYDEEEECFFVVFENRHLTVKSTDWLRKTFKWIIVDVTDLTALEKIFYDSTMSLKSISSIFIFNVSIVVNLTQFNLEIVLSNDIIVYDDASICARLSTIAKIFLNIWQEKTTETIKLFEKEWMSIDIISDVKSKSSRIFRLSKQNQKVIDKKFDELHRQEKMSWITSSTSYAYSCFVIWRTIHLFEKSSKRKNAW